MHELLAPTKYVAAFWVVGFLVIVSGWTLLYTARARSLIERLRIEDEALWKELGEPTKPDELGRATIWRYGACAPTTSSQAASIRSS